MTATPRRSCCGTPTLPALGRGRSAHASSRKHGQALQRGAGSRKICGSLSAARNSRSSINHSSISPPAAGPEEGAKLNRLSARVRAQAETKRHLTLRGWAFTAGSRIVSGGRLGVAFVALPAGVRKALSNSDRMPWFAGVCGLVPPRGGSADLPGRPFIPLLRCRQSARALPSARRVAQASWREPRALLVRPALAPRL